MARTSDGSRKLLAVVVGVLLVVAGGVALVSVFPTASNQGYMPDQPIPFSHKLHAGQFKMPCMYCHVGADKSRHASVPSVNTCMNCHSVVKTDSPYIQQIQKAYKEGKPIEWVRVHELPDHAHFPHNRHIAANISCQTCHGNVQEMEKVYQFAELNMGWCLDCHRGKTTPKQVLKAKFPNVPNARGSQVASITCVACHH